MNSNSTSKTSAGSPSVPCAELQQQLSPYYDGELSGEAREAVEAHLSGCADCAGRLDRFRGLSALAQKLAEPTPPADLWPALEQKLDEQQSAVGPSRTGRLRAWLTTPRAALLAAAAVLVAAVGIGWSLYRGGQTPHDHLAVDFATYVEEFRERPEAAQRLLLARYPGEAVDLDGARREVGYMPAVERGLPEDYRLDAVYVWKMPCCKCVQSICRRADGTTVAIFEHNDEQPTWFGPRPTVDVECDGRACRIFDVENQLAASWRVDHRQITVVGLRDVKDVADLVAHLGGARPSNAKSSPRGGSPASGDST